MTLTVNSNCVNDDWDSCTCTGVSEWMYWCVINASKADCKQQPLNIYEFGFMIIINKTKNRLWMRHVKWKQTVYFFFFRKNYYPHFLVTRSLMHLKSSERPAWMQFLLILFLYVCTIINTQTAEEHVMPHTTRLSGWRLCRPAEFSSLGLSTRTK